MPNYNDNDTRDKSIDELPRMIFQLPNTESGTALPSGNPVFFCQSGCAIDYHFSNIKSCQFDNDGKKFTITPTDTANINYVMWNGTDMNSGEKMVQYTLKEVYFTAPAKDYIGTNNEILNQSIQYYFVFVNEKFSNLMICVSVIGSVNNLGNAPKSNGFVMMETLSTRIPTVDVKSNLGNLNNFNLGTLIPPNKPFFSTLITNNIQYIILTEIVDIPVSFFSNMATMVNGGTQLYTAKMNQFKTNIPKNPPTTILFYNENSQLLDNQNFVCDSNCDLVPAKKITPSIGTYTSSESEKKKEEEKKKKTISGDELPPEKCDIKKVWVDKSTKPKIENPIKSSGTIQDPITSDKDQVVFAITMAFMIGISAFTGYLGALIMKNRKLSLLTIIIGTILLISPIVVGFSVGCSLYYKDNKYHSIPYIVGLIIWGVGLVILKYVNKNYYYNNYSSFNTAISPTMNKQYSTINVPTGFNQPKQSFFGKMFSRSNDSKPIDYTPQITVPTEPNTQPKQSFFSKMFKKSPEQSPITVPPITVPQSSSSSPSITVPQSSSSTTPVSQPKQSFLSKINPFSKSSAAPVATTAKISPSELIKTKTKIIEDIQRTSLNQTNKNKLINKITSSTNSNIVQRLNEAYKELDKLKSTK